MRTVLLLLVALTVSRVAAGDFDVRDNLAGGQDIRDSGGRFVGETRPNLWGSSDLLDAEGHFILEGRPGLDGDTFWSTGVESEGGDE